MYNVLLCFIFFFFSSRRRHTRSYGDWSSDVCSSDLVAVHGAPAPHLQPGNSARGLLLFEEGSRAGRGRGDVAALRGRTGEESPEPFRKAEARSVPSEAGA